MSAFDFLIGLTGVGAGSDANSGRGASVADVKFPKISSMSALQTVYTTIDKIMTWYTLPLGIERVALQAAVQVVGFDRLQYPKDRRIRT